jgi:hypothetical protein
MTRDELVEVAWLAYDKARSVDDGLADAIDAVEPLIRAGLRAKVEALPGAPASGSGWIARDDVLALLDGDSDD